MQGIPEKFEFQLLPEDWDQFEPLMTNAIHRVPALEKAGATLSPFNPSLNQKWGRALSM